MLQINDKNNIPSYFFDGGIKNNNTSEQVSMDQSLPVKGVLTLIILMEIAD